jgi:hypothetical protein
MRIVILIVALVFIGLLGAFTVKDVIDNGFTVPDLFAAVVLLLFCTGILGALFHSPPHE